MLVTTTENVPGHAVRATLGQVFGVVVRSRGIGGNITASLRSIVGGEIPNIPGWSRIRGATLSTGWWPTPR